MSAQVDAAAEGRRLDHWLMEQAPGVSFGDINRLIRTGQVRVDGGRAKPGQRLIAGQDVRLPPFLQAAVDAAARAGSPAGAAPMLGAGLSEVDRAFVAGIIAYEDDDLIVLNKPAGLPVQGGSKQKRHVDGLMRAYYADSCEPKLVHRLDKDTSGLLALGKSARSAARLTEAFRLDQVDKTYLALVEGKPERSGEIDLPLIKARTGRGEAESMQVDIEQGQQALTEYRRLEHFAGISLMDLKPVTGRTHQLRVHLAAIGHPILGDRKYGDGRTAPRLMLHARELTLPDPATGRLLTFRCDPPAAIRDFIEARRT